MESDKLSVKMEVNSRCETFYFVHTNTLSPMKPPDCAGVSRDGFRLITDCTAEGCVYVCVAWKFVTQRGPGISTDHGYCNQEIRLPAVFCGYCIEASYPTVTHTDTPILISIISSHTDVFPKRTREITLC